MNDMTEKARAPALGNARGPKNCHSWQTDKNETNEDPLRAQHSRTNLAQPNGNALPVSSNERLEAGKGGEGGEESGNKCGLHRSGLHAPA